MSTIGHIPQTNIVQFISPPQAAANRVIDQFSFSANGTLLIPAADAASRQFSPAHIASFQNTVAGILAEGSRVWTTENPNEIPLDKAAPSLRLINPTTQRELTLLGLSSTTWQHVLAERSSDYEADLSGTKREYPEDRRGIIGASLFAPSEHFSIHQSAHAIVGLPEDPINDGLKPTLKRMAAESSLLLGQALGDMGNFEREFFVLGSSRLTVSFDLSLLAYLLPNLNGLEFSAETRREFMMSFLALVEESFALPSKKKTVHIEPYDDRNKTYVSGMESNHLRWKTGQGLVFAPPQSPDYRNFFFNDQIDYGAMRFCSAAERDDFSSGESVPALEIAIISGNTQAEGTPWIHRTTDLAANPVVQISQTRWLNDGKTPFSPVIQSLLRMLSQQDPSMPIVP